MTVAELGGIVIVCPFGCTVVTPEGPPVSVVTGPLGELCGPRNKVMGVPLMVVIMPLPQTCTGPLEVLGPRNTVMAEPFTEVATPEPHKAVVAGALLIGAELDGAPVAPSRDEMMLGQADTPDSVDCGTVEVVLVGGQDVLVLDGCCGIPVVRPDGGPAAGAGATLAGAACAVETDVTVSVTLLSCVCTFVTVVPAPTIVVVCS